MNKAYYLFKGYINHKGKIECCPRGIIIKYYSEEQADYMRTVGYALEKIQGEAK